MIPKGLGLINRTKCAYPQRMLTLLLDAAQVFTLAKKSEGKVSLPLCSQTSWYYHYALTLHIAKPGPVYAWHEHVTRNHNSEPTRSIQSFSLNYELFMYFYFCFFLHSYGSFNHTNSTSLSFSEFSELFISLLLLSQLIESHSALSSARCHF